ncbi:hypothetical protein EMCRGX_G002755 [Ephydatia muelleri]
MEVTSCGELERQTPEGEAGHPLGDLCAKLRHWHKLGSQGGGKDGGKLLPLDGAVGKPLVRLSVSALVQKPGPSVAEGQEASPPARPALASNVVLHDCCSLFLGLFGHYSSLLLSLNVWKLFHMSDDTKAASLDADGRHQGNSSVHTLGAGVKAKWSRNISPDPLDETGVAALTSLPRKDWAEDDPAVLRNSPSPLSPLHNHPRTWGGGSGKEIGAMIGIGLDQLQFANYELD